ncbi:hypothetical protein [Delftia acidovorans]|uniref:hypothetical protein n=1 Tax=Delftia acidovorans TaxID=80866 RepID=UPI0028A60A2B|nr:hypothetical protein [Delftia acidovorans]
MNDQRTALPTRASFEQLARTITETNGWVQEGCNEIRALAQLVLASLNAPEDLRRPQAMAHALRAIRDGAESLADYVQGEARSVGCDPTQSP